MPNPATIADVADRFRELTDPEIGLASVLLDDAWDLLLTRRASLDAEVTAGTVREQTARRVLAQMVIRVLRNPDGKLSESIDDYSYRRDEVVSSGLLHVTSDELADLTPGRKRRNSVRLVANSDY